MRQVSRAASILTAALAIASGCGSASADQIYNLNQQGFTLPGVTLPQGQDEVRAADGTTCRSSVGGSGAYFDAGVIQGNTGSGDFATYGRFVMPLGKQAKRIDCSRLYQLEVERLELELRMLKMGLGASGPAHDKAAGAVDADWAEQGWSNSGSSK